MRVGFYGRRSTDLQRPTSIDDQLRVARAFAGQNGWTMDEGRLYSDAGISGSSIDGRAGLQALLAAAEQTPRPIDVLLVDDSSRVSPSPGQLVTSVIRRGMALAPVGIVAGLAGALVIGRLLTSMLYGLPARDPLTLVAAILILTVVAALACWLPARRASRVDPVTALRAE